MKRPVAAWLFGLLLSLAIAGHAETTSKTMDPLCADAELWSGKLITDICWSCLFPIRAAGASLGGGNVRCEAGSRVVPRSDRACVFTERSEVKMQALRNRVESLRN